MDITEYFIQTLFKMGNNAQPPQKTIRHYTHYTRNHPVYLAQQPDSHIIIELEIYLMTDTKVFQEMVNHRKKLNKFQAPLFVSPAFVSFSEVSYEESDDGQCSYCLNNSKKRKKTVARIGYRLIEDDSLSDILRLKKKLNEYFNAKQLKRLIDQLISLLVFFQEKSVIHGNLSSSNVFVFGEKEIELAVLDSFFINEGLTNYQLSLKEPKGCYFLSEAQLKARMAKKSDFKFIHLDDMYSVGMIILEISTLEYSADLYNYRLMEINKELLTNRLSKVSLLYGQDVSRVIGMLFSGEPIKRIWKFCESMKMGRKQRYSL